MTLTETAIFFKKYSKWAAAGLVAAILLWIGIGYLISTYQRLNPTKETPTVRFGQINKPNFPTSSAANLSFVLDTVDGNLPKVPAVLPVYQFATPTPNLLDLDQAKTLAKGLGFSVSPTQSSPESYVFSDPANPAQTLTINIVTKNFTLATTNFAAPSISQTPPAESTDDLITKTRSLLSSQGLLQNDLTKSQASVTYKKIVGSSLVTASSLSEANAGRVDLWRGPVAGYEIVEPSREEALIHVTWSAPAFSKKNLLEIGYTYWPYYIDGSSTYPLQPIDAAWNSLKAGQGTLISPTVASFTDVRIKNIGIGYYQSGTSQSYLQPIYIFDGEAATSSNVTTNVRLYLPAIDPSYFK